MLAYFNCNVIPVTLLLFPNCIMIERYQVIMAQKGQNESSFAFGVCSPKPIHVSYFTCRKKKSSARQPLVFLFCFVLLYHKKAILIHVSLPSLEQICQSFLTWFLCTLSIKTDLIQP